MKERRKSERINLEGHESLKVVLKFSPEREVSLNRDISTGGIGFQLDQSEDIKEGDEVKADLYFCDKMVIHFTLIIRYIRDQVVGAEFLEKDQLPIQAIQTYINCLKAA